MTKRGGVFIVLQNFCAPSMPLPPSTAQYLFIIKTERGGTIIFCRILAPPQCPPHTPPTPQYLFILMGIFIFCRILAPPNAPPPPSTTPQYLTIIITERGGAIIFYRILSPPPPPPSPNATILNNLNDREGATLCL